MRETKIRNARHRRFAEETYLGPGTGAEAAREAGFRGSDAALAVTASRLLTRPEIREAIAARGIPLPGEEGAEEPVREGDVPTDPAEFYAAVASGRLRANRLQVEAMKRRELTLRQRQGADDAETVLVELRDVVDEVQRERAGRLQTPLGVAAELNGLALMVGRRDMRDALLRVKDEIAAMPPQKESER